MTFDSDIDNYLQTYADFTTQKAASRQEYADSIIRLTILMAKHLNSSASFDNKIQLLLKVPEIQEEVETLLEKYYGCEVKYKNFRDFCELYKSKIIELQSRRKYQGINGV